MKRASRPFYGKPFFRRHYFIAVSSQRSAVSGQIALLLGFVDGGPNLLLMSNIQCPMPNAQCPILSRVNLRFGCRSQKPIAKF
ncbi:MAG: hypothetical protein F6J93_13240 [Oscillatoria sp. SIO1A7]|nr:hypothetical protein [Oscillatoria sp. SIO1A7]